jgi:hypothetical protein
MFSSDGDALIPGAARTSNQFKTIETTTKTKPTPQKKENQAEIRRNCETESTRTWLAEQPLRLLHRSRHRETRKVRDRNDPDQTGGGRFARGRSDRARIP